MIGGEGGLAPKPILATLCFYYLPACFVTHHIFVSWRSSSLDRQTDCNMPAYVNTHLFLFFPSWLLGRRKMPETENSSSSMRNDEK